ncbi:MAG: anion permease [Desulfovibrio sp.]|jgi:DASS family divalent anion:Na+ symporter|nr:anion permease [Desulfovibrio sp.]
MTTTPKIPLWKFAVCAIALATGIYVALMAPPAPPEGQQAFLTQKSMIGMGIFLFFAISAMVEIVPDYVSWLLMCTAWGASKCVTFGQAFGFYTSTSWWLILGAMVLAAAVAKCGLLRRIALNIITRFPASYKSQCASLIVAGTVISPLIPSGTVKCSLMTPLSLALSDLMNFSRRSTGAAGLFNAAFLAVAVTIPALLSSTFINYTILGILEKDGKGVSFIYWLLGSLPWLVLTLVVGYFAIQILYKVKAGETVVDANELRKMRNNLGPMSRDEKITLGVLLCSLAFWVTEHLHGISAVTVILMGTAVLCSTGILDRKSFRSSVTWDSLIFMGCAISMTTAFPAMGIDKWIGQVANGLLVPILNDYSFIVFIGIISVLVYVLRLFLVSQTAFVAMFLIFLLPAGNAVGIHPWVMGFVTFTAANTFIVKYQNIQYVPALVAANTAAGEDFVTHGQNVPFAIYYMVSNIIFLALSIPVWKLLGWM